MQTRFRRKHGHVKITINDSILIVYNTYDGFVKLICSFWIKNTSHIGIQFRGTQWVNLLQLIWDPSWPRSNPQIHIIKTIRLSTGNFICVTFSQQECLNFFFQAIFPGKSCQLQDTSPTFALRKQTRECDSRTISTLKKKRGGGGSARGKSHKIKKNLITHQVQPTGNAQTPAYGYVNLGEWPRVS